MRIQLLLIRLLLFRSTEKITSFFSASVGCIGEQQMQSVCDRPPAVQDCI